MNAAPKMLRDTHVTLSHGGGGKAMRDLIASIFTSVFKPDGMEDQARLYDAALVQPGARIAMTTDSFVVDPVEFPGGDIGTLAVCGTINDQAEAALAAIRTVEGGRDACIIGHAIERGTIPVSMTTMFGGNRIVDMLVGEQLPRICQARDSLTVKVRT